MEYGDLTKKNGDSMGLDRTLMGYNGYGYISAYNQNWTPNCMISETKTYWKNIPNSGDSQSIMMVGYISSAG